MASALTMEPVQYSQEEWRELYRQILFPRMIEEKMLNLLRQGQLSKWFSGIGQEAIAVGVTQTLREDDYILPMHRNLGVFTGRNLDLVQLICQLMGRGEGFSKGRERSFHFGTLDHHVVGMISHLGAMLPVADGLALAQQLRGTERIAVAFTGDGATSEGDFHEALNLAAVWKLPVVFVIENNQYGLSTPSDEQYACKDLADRAVGYGMPGEVVDGNDIMAVMSAMDRAASRARAGEGPTLLECKTFRMRGHEEASGTAYVPDELMAEWAKRDPIARLEQRIVEAGAMDQDGMSMVRAEFKDQIQEAVDAAMAFEYPMRGVDEELNDVFAPLDFEHIEPASETEEIRYVDAISDALKVSMDRDENVLIMGQDVAEYGGVFKITDGFVKRFGRERVRNTPIIESGVLGAAMGLGFEGFKPVVEMQFSDFITCGFNQIVNNLAKTHYRWGAKVPVVVRAPIGGGMGAGPYHSQCPESWFTSIAGLKVVAPATPADAKGLLLAAIDDPNPVLFFEHKLLYRSLKGDVPTGFYHEELGKARVVREGSDATIVAWSAMVHEALRVADEMAKDDISIEVVDLRTLIPWDVETVLESVAKTSRVLVLHEASTTGGFGGEVAARIAQDGFDYLDAPVTRVGALDTPVPFAKGLEKQYMPGARLQQALEDLLDY